MKMITSEKKDQKSNKICDNKKGVNIPEWPQWKRNAVSYMMVFDYSKTKVSSSK